MLIRTRLILATAAALALPLAVACDRGPTEPEELPQEELIFLRATPDAPPLAALQAQVWARRGEGRRIEIPYARVGSYGGDRCLELNIPGDALWKRPDGTLYQPGDSVLITVTVSNPNQFHFRFEPSGLQFNPQHPAELRISYKWADRDFNGDGVINDADRNFTFAVWRQETLAAPWYRLRTEKDDNVQEARADVLGFTGYALAGGRSRAAAD
jgi:hypothetical protein